MTGAIVSCADDTTQACPNSFCRRPKVLCIQFFLFGATVLGYCTIGNHTRSKVQDQFIEIQRRAGRSQWGC